MESKDARLTPTFRSILLMATALAGCFDGSDDALGPGACKKDVRARIEAWYKRDAGVET